MALEGKSDKVLVAELGADFDGVKEGFGGCCGIAFAKGSDADGKLEVAALDARGLIFEHALGTGEPAARLSEVSHVQGNEATPESPARGAAGIAFGEVALVSACEEIETLCIVAAEMSGNGEISGVFGA